ncbi:uncharacterized protein TNCV_3384381 [Trichonephila clavipes]|uniref:Uncharacterized protein n=1 Tax=Trichonephila clavipes TaxID=2585209 RepID=A0A8X6VRH3_TRICX|nr:uncharacterized protein TNCV_3384381 [Trichonephila clavipes]
MVSDGTEFTVGDIERLFEEARRNTKAKHEKWEKYYNTRRRDVQIKVNDWVMVATHPLNSATRKEVIIYRHSKCDKTEIGTGSSDNGSLRDESSGFDRVQRRSNESRDGKKKGSERGRHNKEDQFDPEKAEEGTIAPTSKNEQDLATRMPDKEVINNCKTRKREERVRKSLCPWRSCHIKIMFDPSSFADPTPLAQADASRDVLPRGGTSQM